MSGAVAPPSPAVHPRRVNGHNVVCEADGLSWTSPAGPGQMSFDNILFVLDAGHLPTRASSHIACCLREHPDNPATPFELLLLAADELPDELLQQHCLLEFPNYLRQGDANRVDVLVSTKSGTGLALPFWDTVLQPLWGLVEESFGFSSQRPNVLITESAQSVRQFSKKLYDGEPESDRESAKSRTIVLLSGDGGVVDMLNGDHETEIMAPLPMMALLPLGTGNALFHSLHKPVASNPGPSPLVLGLRTLFRGVTADLPIFRSSFSPGSRIVSFAEESKKAAASRDDGDDGDVHVSRHETAVSHLYGAIVASYGFHASIVYESDTPEYRKHGDKRFGMVAQELLRESHPYTARVAIRRPGSSGLETDPRSEHAYVLVTPLSNLERTFTISPDSKPLDGKLRLVQFGAIGGERTMDVMMKAYDGGKHVGMKWDDGEEVMYEEIEEIKVVTLEKNERWRKVCVDGTIVDIPEGGEMSVSKVDRGRFRILVNSRVLQGE